KTFGEALQLHSREVPPSARRFLAGWRDEKFIPAMQLLAKPLVKLYSCTVGKSLHPQGTMEYIVNANCGYLAFILRFTLFPSVRGDSVK
ncbi:MAG TPA: hypothetical protein PLU64_19455, partial [Saprospiraceae bacterium]|nr:hypothetical protein [Saprospiraceae bacterium]